MVDPDPTIEEVVCALLRGDRACPASTHPGLPLRYRDYADYHGVSALLVRRSSQMSARDRRAARQIKDESAIELVRKHELVRVLDALARAGVGSLLLKGAALAYSVYPAPVLRPRADTDLLIRSADQQRTERTLTRLGYAKPSAISGEFVTYQCGYLKRDRRHIEHVLDVHWRISNAQQFSRTLAFEELISRSVQIPALGEHARGLCRSDALLLACMHRVHHFNSPYRVEGLNSAGRERLIWLYDMHLLVGAMSPTELVEFARRATDKGVGAVCNDGLLRARNCFATRVCENVLRLLATAGPRDPSAARLRAGNVRLLLMELRCLPRWRDRVALLGEHLFPPSDYMLEKYAVTSRAWLPVLYLQRGVHGVWKRIHAQ